MCARPLVCVWFFLEKVDIRTLWVGWGHAQEIEKAWKMYEAAHDREVKAKETVQQLKQQIQHLSQLVGKGADLSAGQESTVNDLLRIKEELTQGFVLFVFYSMNCVFFHGRGCFLWALSSLFLAFVYTRVCLSSVERERRSEKG